MDPPAGYAPPASARSPFILPARPEPLRLDPAQTALVVVDMQNAYASPGGYIDLAGKDEVYALIKECVEAVNAELATEGELSHSQIARFLILHKELDPDDDEMTRTRKVRRGFVAEKYAALLDGLYGGKTVQHIDTKVKFEDGRSGSIAADIKINDAKRFPAVTKAAA